MNTIKNLGLVAVFCLVLTSCGGGDSEPPPAYVTNLAPVIQGSKAVDVLEGDQLSAEYSFSDPENSAVITSLSGPDAGLMTLSSDGNLTFSQLPDYETAADSDANNIYQVNIVASDSVNQTLYAVSITVNNAIEGRVVDGPLSGSVVFVDLDADKTQDPDEPTGITDAQGYFSFAELVVVPTGTQVIAKGGTDIQTGIELPNLVLTSEISSSVDGVAVTPLTTVLNGLSGDEKVTVLMALGLNVTPASLLTSDGWATAQSGDVSSQAVQRINQQIAVLLQAVSAMVAVDETTTAVEQAGVVAKTIAKAAQQQVNFSFASTASVTSIIFDSLTEIVPGVFTDVSIIRAVAQGVAIVNTVFSDEYIDPTGVLAADMALAQQTILQTSIVSLATADINTATYIEQTGLAVLLVDATIPIDAPDQDSDGIADILDDDNDGDGVADIEDDFPDDETETTDTDGDGIGNNVDEDVVPVITIVGTASVNHEQGTVYNDAGATATGTVSVVTTGIVNIATAGTYTITYNANNIAGNAATPVTRTVMVSDTSAPVISLFGLVSLTHLQGTIYSDLGATALDIADGNVSVVTTGNVDTATVGTYTITYTATDIAGNTATAVTRTVTVSDTSGPIISLLGFASLTHPQGTIYIDLGATAADIADGTVSVVTTGTVDTATVGTYTITYTATDSAGNAATPVTRTVTVSDTTALEVLDEDKPVITVPVDKTLTSSDGLNIPSTDPALAEFLSAATATDNVDGILTVTSDAPSSFPIGTTTVTFSAVDAAGNSSTSSAVVTVANGSLIYTGYKLPTGITVIDTLE